MPGAGPPSQHVKVGDDFTVRELGGGGLSTFKVAALSDTDFAGNGVLMSHAAARAVFGARGAPSRAYVDVSDPDLGLADLVGAQVVPRCSKQDPVVVHFQLGICEDALAPVQEPEPGERAEVRQREVLPD